jgi:hypothetical protein
LAKDRQARFVNARQLGDALAQWLVERDQHDDVCGEPLVSSWGPQARSRTVPDRLCSDLVLPMRTLQAAPAQDKKRRRATGVATAICLGLAASGLVFLRSDIDGHGRANPPQATDVDAVQHRVTSPLILPAELSAAPDPQLTAAVPSEDEAETFAQLPVGTGHKPSSVRARLTRLTGKATNRARSQEAKLGLKDPFE